VDPDSRRSLVRSGDGRTARLRVSVTDGAGRAVRDGGLSRWLTSVAPARAAGEVGIALVSDARIRALNRQYRRKDTPTDVLSFRSDSVSITQSWRGASALGDIVIATGVARRQAKDAGHSLQAELRVLALHGLLHLLGYDHHARDDGGRMARVEARLRRKGGLEAGLIERASSRSAELRARA
jgi:probable rRNA maturation factor